MAEGIYSLTIDVLSKKIDSSVKGPFDANTLAPSKAYKEVGARILNFISMWPGVAIHSLDLACGLTAGTLSIVTLGLSRRINKLSAEFFNSSRNLTADFFAGIIKTINPEADGLKDKDNSEFIEGNNQSQYVETGSCAKEAVNFFKSGESMTRSPKFWVRHGVSRIVYTFSIITFTIARVIDFAIGIIMGIGAVVCGGKNKKLNEGAYRHLKITALVADIVECIRKIINPRSISGFPRVNQYDWIA